MTDPFVDEYLNGLREVLDEIDRDAIDRAIGILWDAYRADRRIFLIGNGGSAATASHMMCDLAKGCAVPGRRRIRAMSLTDNTAVLTAVGNDVSFDKVFTLQLEVFLEEGDVVVAITASGNSPNILDAVRYARDHGAVTLGLIGFGGGKLKALVDTHITVSSRNYGHVEDVHCMLEHLLSQRLRQKVQAGGPYQKPRVPALQEKPEWRAAQDILALNRSPRPKEVAAQPPDASTREGVAGGLAANVVVHRHPEDRP